MHRLESGERAEGGDELRRNVACRDNDEGPRDSYTDPRTRISPFSPSFSSLSSFFFPLYSREGARARERRTNERAWTETRTENLKRRLFIPRSHSRLRYHTSLGDHSRTATEPATPPMVGNSGRLVPGLGHPRPRSAASAAPRARAEVLIGSRPRHGRPVDEAGWGSGAAHGRVPGPIRRDPTCRVAPRYTGDGDDGDDDGSRCLFPACSFFSLSLPPLFRSPDSFPVSLALIASKLPISLHFSFFPISSVVIATCLYLTPFIFSLSFSFTDPLNVYHPCSVGPTSRLHPVPSTSLSPLVCLKPCVISYEN